jgi:DNA-binding response OmpR family regulator
MSKILIADDEVHMRDLVERALEPLQDLNVELFIAAGGFEALELAKKLVPELVILDVMMPDLNGKEVCKQLKKSVSPPYVMMLTAMGQKMDKIDALEVGADEYITKPFDPDKLLERVAQILKVLL